MPCRDPLPECGVEIGRKELNATSQPNFLGTRLLDLALV
jgi:hypothetical protein